MLVHAGNRTEDRLKIQRIQEVNTTGVPRSAYSTTLPSPHRVPLKYLGCTLEKTDRDRLSTAYDLLFFK